MKYRVSPGIYAVGNPGRNAPVFVTANFKLSFDHLRRSLEAIDGWIMVIETRGINVWCAAGKGTFGTKEVVKRIRYHHLAELVDHRNVILPQLSAIGVAAHEVKKLTGFRVIYGPVLAKDIKAFLDAGLRATDAMRKVEFPFTERVKLIPVDIFYGKYYLLLVPAVFILLSGFSPHGYSVDLAMQTGLRSTVNLWAGYLAGCLLVPALLPWIPFRLFSAKGLVTGVTVSILLMLAGTLGKTPVETISWFLMIAGLSSFMAMNFTGSSTFTSLSGVQKEMKMALPLQIASVGLGFTGWMITRFF
jgi:acetyl-CoA decarbonylase/synthase complex subunit gamma